MSVSPLESQIDGHFLQPVTMLWRGKLKPFKWQEFYGIIELMLVTNSL